MMKKCRWMDQKSSLETEKNVAICTLKDYLF